jgi:hypothetical protein
MHTNPMVDAWFAAKQPDQEQAMRRVREIILGADERVTESIQWHTPTFECQGKIASFGPDALHVTLLFDRGAEIPGDHPRLEGEGELARTMRFDDLDDVESGREDIEAVIRAWCAARGAS